MEGPAVSSIRWRISTNKPTLPFVIPSEAEGSAVQRTLMEMFFGRASRSGRPTHPTQPSKPPPDLPTLHGEPAGNWRASQTLPIRLVPKHK